MSSFQFSGGWKVSCNLTFQCETWLPCSLFICSDERQIYRTLLLITRFLPRPSELQVLKPISKHDFNFFKVWSPATAKRADMFVFGMGILGCEYFLSLVCRLLLHWDRGWCWTSKSFSVLQSEFPYSGNYTKGASLCCNHSDHISKNPTYPVRFIRE